MIVGMRRKKYSASTIVPTIFVGTKIRTLPRPV
jgi:hypothetical protein